MRYASLTVYNIVRDHLECPENSLHKNVLRTVEPPPPNVCEIFSCKGRNVLNVRVENSITIPTRKCLFRDEPLPSLHGRFSCRDFRNSDMVSNLM